MTQINSLVELAQAIEAGKEIEYSDGMAVGSLNQDLAFRKVLKAIAMGRISTKPSLKTIDMTPFIENGLDVCFGDRPDQCYFIGSLKAIHKSEQLVDLYQDQTNSEWKFCRPRLNHPFIWTSDIDLPVGLVVEYAWDSCTLSDKRPQWLYSPPRSIDQIVVARITGCKEDYCFAGEEEQ
jgi:hypothetical protein